MPLTSYSQVCQAINLAVYCLCLIVQIYIGENIALKRCLIYRYLPTNIPTKTNLPASIILTHIPSCPAYLPARLNQLTTLPIYITVLATYTQLFIVIATYLPIYIPNYQPNYLPIILPVLSCYLRIYLHSSTYPRLPTNLTSYSHVYLQPVINPFTSPANLTTYYV